MPTPNTAPSAFDMTSFAAVAGSRSWEWLLALRHRLHVEIQLVDAGYAPLLPPAASGRELGLSLLLSSETPALRAALSTVLRTRTPEVVTVGAIQVACVPLTVRGRVAGALAVARTAASGEAAAEPARARLELLGRWLATAAEAHLSSPSAVHINVSHVVPLWRLLSSVAEKGTDRDLVAAFAEALAVWHDIDVRGYVETAERVFVREVSMGGRMGSGRPVTLPAATIPEPLEFRRLPSADLEEDGSSADEDVLVTRLRGMASGRSWLLALPGRIDRCDPRLLAAYVALLDMTVAFGTEAWTRRMATALSRLLVAGGESPAVTASLALDEISRAVGDASVLLTVDTPAGAVLLRVGLPDRVVSAAAEEGTARIALSLAHQKYVTKLEVWRPEGGQLMPLERHAVEAALDLLHAWARGAVLGDPGRTEADSFEPVLERLAQDALDRGTTVSAAVLRIAEAAMTAGGSRGYAHVIRRQMRDADVVGVLPDGQLGLLLHDATAARAPVIIRRLARALEAVATATSPVVSVGFATRMPGQAARGIVQDALKHAVQRENTARARGKDDPNADVR